MRFITVALLALVSVPALALGQVAQTPAATPDDGKREFVISGCLLRSGYAGYQVDDAKIESIDGKPVPTQPAASVTASPATPKKWMLDGGGNLGPRTGEKVQVVGRTDWQPPSSSAGASEEPERTPRLDVKSVKTIASSCS